MKQKLKKLHTVAIRILPAVILVFSLTLSLAAPAKAAMIVEALGAHSYIDLRNVYYEITLKDKLSRDEYTAQMLDIIVNNKTVDLGVINEFAWGSVISSFLTSIRKSGGAQLASLYEKNVSKFESTLEKIMGQLESLE